MREFSDEQIEQKIQAIHAERAELNQEARGWRRELDRRCELEALAARYAEAGEAEQRLMLERLGDDGPDVEQRSRRYASHSQRVGFEVPQPPVKRPPWWRR